MRALTNDEKLVLMALCQTSVPPSLAELMTLLEVESDYQRKLLLVAVEGLRRRGAVALDWRWGRVRAVSV